MTRALKRLLIAFSLLLGVTYAFAQPTFTVTNVKNACAGLNNGSFDVNILTANGSVTLQIFGPPNFIRTTSAGLTETFIGLKPNTYIVVAQDADGSTVQSQVIANISPNISFSSAPVVANNTNCTVPDGSISISPTGGSGVYGYSWTGPGAFSASTQNISGLVAGNYVVTITDAAANCSFTSAPIPVTDPLPSPFTISSPGPGICLGDILVVNLSASQNGVTYRIFVDGGSTATTVTGPTPTINYSGLPAGSHTISVQASFGICTPIFSTNTLTIQVNTPPASATLSLAGANPICAGQSTSLTVTVVGGTGPFSFTITGLGPLAGYTSGNPIAVTPAATTTYTLSGTVTDANGCTVTGTGSVTVTVNPIPTGTINASPAAICAGQGSSTLTFTLTGASPYNVSYSDGTTTFNLVGIATGHTVSVSPATTKTYTITAISDANTCVGLPGSNTTVTVSSPPSSATLSLTGPDPICAGQSTTMVVNIVGGIGPYDFTIAGLPPFVGYVSGTAINVTPPVGTTNYILAGVTVTDSKGCTVVGTGGVSIIVHPLPTALVAASPGAICVGQGNSTLTFTMTGTGPYNVSYSDGSSTFNLAGIASGHTVVVSPASTKTYTVTSIQDATTCSGAPGSNTTVTVSTPPSNATLSGTATICSGATTNLNVAITGGTGPFIVTINNGVGTINNYVSGALIPVSPVVTTTYTVTAVTDASGCASQSLSGTPVVTVNPSLTSAVLSGNGTICGGASANLIVTITGGVSPYSVTIDNGVGTINNYVSGTAIPVNPAVTTTYSIVGNVTDANCGVAGTGSATVTVNTPPSNATLSGTATICSGTSTNLSVAVTGVTGPFIVTINNGVGTINNYVSGALIPVSPVVTTTYAVTAVTDANGCASQALSGTAVVTVNQSPTSAVLSGNAAICGPGSSNLIVNITGGFGPYTVTIDNGVGTINNYISGTAIPANSAATTTYSIVGNVTDVNNCGVAGTGSATVTVNTPPSNATLSGTATVCSGTSTNLSVVVTGGTGPFAVTIDNGVGTINNYVSGTPIPVTPLLTTTYSVTAVTDANLCASQALSGTAIVTVNPSPTSAVLSGNAAICGPGPSNLKVTITGGVSPYTVTIDNGVGTINNYLSGTVIPVNPGVTTTYSIVGNVTDANTCGVAGTGSATVTVNTPPSNSTLSGTATICSGTSTNLSVAITGGTGPFAVTIDNGVGTINNYVSGAPIPVSPLVSTTYTVTAVTDANGCASQALSGTAVVTVNPTPDATINPAGPYCSNDLPVTLTAVTGGGTWSGTGITNPAAGTFDPGIAGPGTFPITYSVTVAGCTGVKTRNIKVNGAPDATITPAGPFCVTDPTTNLTAATPGGTWSGTGIVNAATGSFDPPTAGTGTHTITYTVTLGTGCTDTKTASITVASSPDATITPAGPYCTNDTAVNLTAATAGGSWSGTGITNAATGTFNPATAGAGTFTITYTVTVGGCSDAKTTSIVVNQAPDATITAAGPFCITDAPVTMSAATAGGTWSGTGITNTATGAFDPATAGVGTFLISYSVTSGSCTDVKSINITVANPPDATITPAGPYCTNDAAVNLTAATAGGSWSGTGITNAATGTFNPATAGAGTFTITYTITIGGCSDTKTTSIVVNQAPDATITAAGPFCITDAPVTLSAATAGGTWSGAGITNAATGTFDPATAGVGTFPISYSVTSGSCTDTKSINITIANPPDATITLAGPYCTNDAAVNLTAATAGGNWSGTGITNAAAGTFDPATAGAGTFTITYTVTIGGCSDTKTASIQVNTAPVVTITPVGPFCTASPSLNLNASVAGGTWSGTGITDGAAGTFSPATAGVGTFTISYLVTSGGCTTTANKSITVNAICGGVNCGTFTTSVSDTRPSCSNQNDGVININVSGGTPNYIVTLTDGGSFNQALAGPGPTFTFTNLSPADYQYTLQDANGNSCTLPHSLPIQATVLATANQFIDAVCFNQAVGGATVTVNSGGAAPFEYSVDGGTSWIVFTSPVTINNLMPSASPYSILVRDDATDLCPAQVMVTIHNALADIDAPYTITNATCNNNDGSLQIGTITGGTPPYSYVMDGVPFANLPANNTFTSLTGGAHLFTVVDANSCQKDFPVIVSFPGLVSFSITGVNPDCTGNGTNGQLTVTITSVGSFQVGVSADPVTPPASFQNVISAGSSTVTFNGLGQGTYYITAKSASAQCPTVTRSTLTAGPIAVDFQLTAQDILCSENKGGVTLKGILGSSTVPYNYQILNLGNIVQSGVITSLQAIADVPLTGLDRGDYQIQLTQDQSAATGCAGLITSAFKPFTINGPTGSLDTLYVNRTISLPDLATGSMLVGIQESGLEPYEVRLELTQPFFAQQSYLLDWTAATRNPQNLKVEYNVTKLFAGVYKLSLRDAMGCEREYSLTIEVNTDVFIPNIFTPNNDGINDVFFIRNLPAEANIVITNRWGSEVYRSSNYANDWTGGNAQDGIFYYRLQAGGHTFTGWLEIQRGLGQP